MICLFIVVGMNQAFAQGDDHGNSCETGTPIDLVALTTSATQEILGALTQNDQDFFIIGVPSVNAIVTLSTAGETDTFGRISQVVDGVPIFLEDDSSGGPGNRNFLLSRSLDEGTYCVEVRGQSTGTEGPYILRVEADIPGDDHGNSCDTATPVGRSEIIGELSVFDDGDFFLFQIPPGGSTLTVNTTGETDTFGRISQVVDGVPIFLEDDSSGGPGNRNFLLSRSLDEGTYCVEVRGQSTGTRGPYVLQVAGDIIPAGSCSGLAVAVSAPSLAFGPVAVGLLSVPQSVTISNTGSGLLFIDSSTLGGTDASQFGILNDTCAERALQPGEQCSLQGIFAPLAAGSKAAFISIPCNDLDSLPLEVGLSGDGTATL